MWVIAWFDVEVVTPTSRNPSTVYRCRTLTVQIGTARARCSILISQLRDRRSVCNCAQTRVRFLRGAPSAQTFPSDLTRGNLFFSSADLSSRPPEPRKLINETPGSENCSQSNKSIGHGWIHPLKLSVVQFSPTLPIPELAFSQMERNCIRQLRPFVFIPLDGNPEIINKPRNSGGRSIRGVRDIGKGIRPIPIQFRRIPPANHPPRFSNFRPYFLRPIL